LAAYKEAHRDIHILVVAHRMELLDQISATLSRFGIAHGFIQGAREQHLWKRVQVASIMSLLTERNYYNTLRLKFDYIIVDEAHHSLADTYIKLFELFPEAKKLGVTATPWRLNHESFLSLYQTLIVSPQISWFISNNLLADFDYVSIKPDSDIQRLVDRSEVADTGDFVNADLDNTFNNQRIRSKVYESYKRFADGRKGIIYAINKLHASKIAELYCSHGINAVAIDCDTPKDERQELISRFKTGEITVLVNVEIFTEGFDCPDVSFIQLARPTKSLALYLQQVGRGLRMVEGKEKTIIIDNVGLYNYFGLPDANRKWQYHFKGHDDVEHSSSRRKDTLALRDEEYEFDESRLAEDDEEMMIVRGASDEILKTSNYANKVTATLPIEEISLCDYYLIRGNAKKFKVYPLTKKKGKTTGAVGGCIYEYDAEERPVTFTHNVKENMILMDGDAKLRTLIAFSAMLLNKTISEILDLDNLCCISQSDYVTKAGLFEVLKMMSKIQS
ncbi:MAG: DEAD/DEAH box helicase, partial [Prevotella sp.]|nr:DEAD/DEAH box helicase [Prevotella sp.]